MGEMMSALCRTGTEELLHAPYDKLAAVVSTPVSANPASDPPVSYSLSGGSSRFQSPEDPYAPIATPPPAPPDPDVMAAMESELPPAHPFTEVRATIESELPRLSQRSMVSSMSSPGLTEEPEGRAREESGRQVLA